MSGCSVEGCDNPFYANGKCRRHYARDYNREYIRLPHVQERVREYNRKRHEANPLSSRTGAGIVICTFGKCSYPVQNHPSLCNKHRMKRKRWGYE